MNRWLARSIRSGLAVRRPRVAFAVIDFLLLFGIFLLLYDLPTSPAGGTRRLAQDSQFFIRGDSNGDHFLDLSDAVNTLNYLFVGVGSVPCLAAADSNDDGVVDLADSVYWLSFLFIGGAEPPPPFPDAGADPTEDVGCRDTDLPPLPAVGEPGGPDRTLTSDESLSWRRGRAFFMDPATLAQGLGNFFNGDSCDSCHVDPVIGGAGGIDVDVVRFARVEEDVFVPLSGEPAVSRQTVLDIPREECPPEANVIETRQTPTILGLGLIDRIPAASILVHADPEDADGDGISGRARMVNGRLGRFGHKAGVPSLIDFTADALFNEVGLTVDAALSSFATASDSDDAPDPEVDNQDFLDTAFFLSHLAPPERASPATAEEVLTVSEGEDLFTAIGCASCHVPELEGPEGAVAAYSDFLLHDVANPARLNVPESGVEPREFRTAPLWGVRDTAPYLHDGSAETLERAIRDGHHGEAAGVRLAWDALAQQNQAKVIAFLLSL